MIVLIKAVPIVFCSLELGRRHNDIFPYLICLVINGIINEYFVKLFRGYPCSLNYFLARIVVLRLRIKSDYTLSVF